MGVRVVIVVPAHLNVIVAVDRQFVIAVNSLFHVPIDLDFGISQNVQRGVALNSDVAVPLDQDPVVAGRDRVPVLDDLCDFGSVGGDFVERPGLVPKGYALRAGGVVEFLDVSGFALSDVVVRIFGRVLRRRLGPLPAECSRSLIDAVALLLNVRFTDALIARETVDVVFPGDTWIDTIRVLEAPVEAFTAVETGDRTGDHRYLHVVAVEEVTVNSRPFYHAGRTFPDSAIRGRRDVLKDECPWHLIHGHFPGVPAVQTVQADPHTPVFLRVFPIFDDAEEPVKLWVGE